MAEEKIVGKHVKTEKGLKRNTVGIIHAIFQSQSHVAPAADVALLITGTAAIALGATPLVILLAWIGYFLLVNTNYQFSKYISSAAGYYGFAANGLGNKFGILTGWLFIGNEMLAYPAFGFLGSASLIYLLEPSISSIPYLWIAFILPFMAFVFIIEYLGIRPSLNYAWIAGSIEVAFLVITSVIIIFLVGPRNTLSVFTLSPVNGDFHPVFLALIIGITTLAGSGSVVAISEETKLPKKTIPKSLIYVMLIDLSVVLVTYALTVGWGVPKMSSFATSPDPGILVFTRYLGKIVAIVFAAIIYNSYFMFGLAINNSLSRTIYAMARDNIIFPKNVFAKTHPRYGSPSRVIMMITGFAFIFAIINGLVFGPFEGGVYPFVMIGLMLILTHLINNFALIRFIRINKKKLNVLTHLLIPLVGSALLILAIYYSLVPFPTFPAATYAIIAGIWIFLGIIYSVWKGLKTSKIATVNVD
ncbi:MAG: APC family permease [Thermoplasmatales archaeon]